MCLDFNGILRRNADEMKKQEKMVLQYFIHFYPDKG